ncbi:MAG: aminotransferase class I/II-fold pyridoxal phosphate-dependent enzyme [Candidatus Competibacteraceae bacterium]|jgi:arginine decarboxylase|nr:aminotransferase class I/II-fold pyridoxal phosphate-dependent enzyme [Candidatus Competibacteraceae bacterium]
MGRASKTRRARSKTGISLNAYHSVMQLRTEGWKKLKDDTSQLAEAVAQGCPTDKLKQSVAEGLALLEPIDSYWAFPSRQDSQYLSDLFDDDEYDKLSRVVARINRALASFSYRNKPVSLFIDDDFERREDSDDFSDAYQERERQSYFQRPYFEVLIVDNISPREEEALRAGLRKMRRAEDDFVYEVVVVPSFEDALIAVLFNFNIQACVIRYGFPLKSQHQLEILRQLLEDFEGQENEHLPPSHYGPLLGAKIAELRPELDLYMVTDMAVEEIAGKLCSNFRRVFYREEDYIELDLSILRGVNARYQTPFFTALTEYSKQPTGVFHALPISRGKSIIKSNWIQDMLQFYGPNVFMAETSATSGGLDSLLDPTGPIKKAQELAARAFGARQTFFVTNGTSTGNKIVVQALVEPGDIVLVDRNCHKSHHYGMVLGGAQVAYLDSYPLEAYTMYGAVPLKHIKETLLGYKRAGTLAQVKMLLLTNCTFDGVIYDVERVMEECLAIKPDLIFLWDEAWFAFAGFHPTYRRRTGMASAARLRERYLSPEYRKRYADFKDAFEKKGADDDKLWLETRLLPDPDKVRIRTYVTQSTHKRLTALRQGSMIHVFDQDFKHKVEDAFHEAYMTHTSTSPNYQILASLDIGRRQMELEGFEFVQRQTELAMVLRESVTSHPLLSKYFNFLTVEDLIPVEYRPSGIEFYYSPEKGWSRMETAWRQDEFVLDPSHLNLNIGMTGIDGDHFKHDYLMDKYGIQVNKTTRNTVLFMTNIGTTRSSVAYLIEVLVKIAHELDDRQEDLSSVERRLHQQKIHSLTHENPPLPNFSRFHDAFRINPAGHTRDGDLRKAFFMSYKDEFCEYVKLNGLRRHIAAGREMVSAMFVIPYPPGFPVLVPGQVISEEILAFMQALDTREIHGYRAELGFRVFTEAVLQTVTAHRLAEPVAEPEYAVDVTVAK